MQRSRIARFSNDWLSEPPLDGGAAVAFALAAIAIPASVRLAIFTGMNDYQCITFCPFVLASAVLLKTRFALGVAIGSALTCNLLMGAHYMLHSDEPDLLGSAIFLGYSLLVVGCMHLARKRSAQPREQEIAREAEGGIVFSLEAGEAWASWPGADAPVRLGAEKEVAFMMEDFLAQLELGRRLESRRARRA